MRAVAWVLLVAVVVGASGAQASILENLLQPACALLPEPPLGDTRAELCTLQYDGGHHGDASDTCAQPSPAVFVGETTSGVLVPVDDRSDNYALALRAGQTVTVALVAQPLVPPTPLGAPKPIDFLLGVFTPGCSSPVAPVQADDSRITFTATVPGVYTVQVLSTRGLGIGAGLPGLPILGSDPSPGPGTDECHPTCFFFTNGVAGYGLSFR